MRLWPKSLLGQMLLAVALALLIAQTISATLLWQAGENRREQAALNAAAIRIVTVRPDNRRSQATSNQDRDRRGTSRGLPRGQRGGPNPVGRWPRALRLEWSPTSPLIGNEQVEIGLTAQFAETLAEQGLLAAELAVFKRRASADPFIRGNPRLIRRLSNRGSIDSDLIIAGVRMPDETQWRVARVLVPRPQNGALRTIIAQTLLIYVMLVGLLYLLLRRITRPLAALTHRTENFGQRLGALPPLPEQGPEDISRLIAAHNAMEARIAALLDEKDVMLGAIGHDLKTPLAALRVRIESVEDENERGKMAHSIEDITRSLDDILSLARIGRASAPPEKAQLAALVMSVIEEFEDMEQPVTAGEIERIAYPVHVTWLKRALRNLVSNALRYGGGAEISLEQSSEQIILRVDDDGPGIPEDKIASMLEPFIRGETSRNRDTGGAGLGLTLARAIAEQHGGTLSLSNRESGGLRAEIRLPKSA